MIQSIGGLANGIFAVVVVLGACIFFHELGHFTVAKLFGMKVEEFAMGFGRALWRRQHGETVYRVNLIPLGGYVRIAGMEPGAEPDERGFYAFARWKGALVLLVGSVMNVVLAAAAFIAVILATGMGVFPGDEITIEKVLPGTPSAEAGIEPGDQLLAVDGIEHSLLVMEVKDGSLAAKVGMTGYDRIYEVNGTPIDLPHQLLNAMVEAQEAPQADADAESPPEAGAAGETTEDGPSQTGAEDSAAESGPKGQVALRIVHFSEDGDFLSDETVSVNVPPDLAESVGVGRAGPVLERVLGVSFAPIGTTEAIAYISAHPEEQVEMTLLRDGKRVTTTVTPEKEWARVPSEDEEGRMTAVHQAVGRIGVVLHGETRPATFVEALHHGIVRSVDAVVLTAGWLFKMITGEVAPQASGPVGIAAVTADRARIGWTAVASVAGLISANLAIINLLPFPPFDGFRIVLLGIEAVMGRRVNERIEVGVTITGVAILLGLFLVITFRDIFNLVLFQTP